MPARKSARTAGRRRRSLWADDPTWVRADEMAAADALTVGHVLSALLGAYADGTVNVPIPLEEVRSGTRGQHPTTITDASWSRADARRRREGIQSMSVLCELLLTEYTGGRVGVGVAVRTRDGRDPRTDDPHCERDGSLTPSLLAV